MIRGLITDNRMMYYYGLGSEQYLLSNTDVRKGILVFFLVLHINLFNLYRLDLRRVICNSPKTYTTCSLLNTYIFFSTNDIWTSFGDLISHYSYFVCFLLEIQGLVLIQVKDGVGLIEVRLQFFCNTKQLLIKVFYEYSTNLLSIGKKKRHLL